MTTLAPDSNAILTKCSCGQRLRIRQHQLGNGVVCPTCSRSFRASRSGKLQVAVKTCLMCGAKSPLPATDCNNCGTAFPRKKTATRSDLSSVKSGLRCLLAAAVAAAVLIGLAILAIWLRSSAVLSGVVVGSLGVSVLGLVGQFGCLSVPKKSGAAGLMTAAFTINLVTLGFQLLRFVMPIPMPVSVGAALASLTASVLLIVYLARLARFIGRDDVARTAFSLIILGFVSIGLSVVSLLIASASQMLSLILVAAVLGLTVVMIMRYVSVLAKLIRAM